MTAPKAGLGKKGEGEEKVRIRVVLELRGEAADLWAGAKGGYYKVYYGLGWGLNESLFCLASVSNVSTGKTGGGEG
jgi:hypothetical protein